jgi:hypothetical protein
MRSLVGILAGALLLGAVTVAGAQTVESGIVIRTDPQANVVVLDDGRIYRVTPNTMLVVENRATPLTALRPGQRVMVQSGEVVVLRDGQYVALAPAPSPTVVTQAPAGTVITQAPPVAVSPAPATAVPVGVRQTFHGTVTSVDRNGEVEIKTERDSFEIKVGTEALRSIKKGDNVTLDLTITPPGAPSALPR